MLGNEKVKSYSISLFYLIENIVCSIYYLSKLVALIVFNHRLALIVNELVTLGVLDLISDALLAVLIGVNVNAIAVFVIDLLALCVLLESLCGIVRYLAVLGVIDIITVFVGLVNVIVGVEEDLLEAGVGLLIVFFYQISAYLIAVDSEEILAQIRDLRLNDIRLAQNVVVRTVLGENRVKSSLRALGYVINERLKLGVYLLDVRIGKLKSSFFKECESRKIALGGVKHHICIYRIISSLIVSIYYCIPELRLLCGRAEMTCGTESSLHS